MSMASKDHRTQILQEEHVYKHNPLRIGGPAMEWIFIYTHEDLVQTLSRLKQQRKNWMVSWPFQDMICRDGGYRGVIIRLCGVFEQIRYERDGVWLGSAALWASLQSLYFHSLGHWSGSVGGFFAQKDIRTLKGCSYTLQWLQGKKIIEEEFTSSKTLVQSKKKRILLSMYIKKISKRKLSAPQKNGEILTLSSRDSLEKIFVQYQLCGIRLKSWLLSRQHPGRIIQLGVGNCKDLLLLHQGLKDRVKKISGKTIELRISPFGKEDHNARRKK